MAWCNVRPFPSHFGKSPCKRKGCGKNATKRVEAQRPSRSENLRKYIVGSYCDEHADEVSNQIRTRPDTEGG